MRIAGKLEEVKLLPMTSAELDRPAARPGMAILDIEKYSQLCKEQPRDWETALQDYLINDLKLRKNYYVRGFKK